VSSFQLSSEEAAPPTPAALPPEVAARLDDPRVAADLVAIIDRLDVVALAITSLDDLLRHSETILGSAVESLGDLRDTVSAAPGAEALDPAATAEAVTALLAALPQMAPALIRGSDSGAIDELTAPPIVDALRLLSGGLRDARADARPVEVSGGLSLVRSLRDPDVARSLGFGLTVLRAVGRRLAQERPSPTDGPSGQ